MIVDAIIGRRRDAMRDGHGSVTRHAEARPKRRTTRCGQGAQREAAEAAYSVE
jgi:hypothetical protein